MVARFDAGTLTSDGGAVLLRAVDRATNSRYKNITVDIDAVERLFVDVFVRAHPTPPTAIVLNRDARAGALEEVQRIVAQLRANQLRQYDSWVAYSMVTRPR